MAALWMQASQLKHARCATHVLREPPETLAVPLALDDGAHEDLNRADVVQGDLALQNYE